MFGFNNFMIFDDQIIKKFLIYIYLVIFFKSSKIVKNLFKNNYKQDYNNICSMGKFWTI